MKFTYPENTGISYSLCVPTFPPPARFKLTPQHKRWVLRRSSISIRFQRLEPCLYPSKNLLATRYLRPEQQWLYIHVPLRTGWKDSSARSLCGSDEHYHVLQPIHTLRRLGDYDRGAVEELHVEIEPVRRSQDAICESGRGSIVTRDRERLTDVDVLDC